MATLMGSSLRSLYLSTSITSGYGHDALPPAIGFLVKSVIIELPILDMLSVDIPIDGAEWKQVERCWRMDLANLIKEINNALGVDLEDIRSKAKHCIGIRWDAGINKTGTLTWTDESIKRNSIGLVYSRLIACQKVELGKRYYSQSLGFNGQTCFDCLKQSCHCHAIIVDHEPTGVSCSEAEGPDEDCYVDATLLGPIEIAHAVLKRKWHAILLTIS
jgi:hypothetical protein